MALNGPVYAEMPLTNYSVPVLQCVLCVLVFVFCCAADNGHFYCGQRVLTCSCCDGGVCGPTAGCNCSACKQLDLERADMKQSTDAADSNISSAEIINSWTWGKQPGQCANSN